MPLPLFLESLLLVLAGAGHVFAYSPAALGLNTAWWLALPAVALLAWRVALACSPGRAAWLGWCFGTAWLVAATGWLFISMHRYGGLPAWLAALAVLALSGFLSTYLALAMAAFARWRSGRPGADAVLFGLLWLGAELARGLLFTGFPWAASGYAHVEGPLAALAPWLGVYGLGAVAAAWAAWAVGSRRGVLLGGVGLLLLALGARVGLPGLAPGGFTQPTGSLSLSLLQGNIPQDEKFVPQHMPEAIAWYSQALLAAEGDLVIAPETALPLLPEQMPDELWEALRLRFAADGRAALVGVPLGDMQSGYSNSVAGFSAATVALPRGIYRYDKHHLVPFGEFIPPGFRWFVRMMNIPLGDFERGALVQASFAVRGAGGTVERVAPNVCYEDLFGEELAARLVHPRSPTVYANVSNIAWFGESLAVEQHLQISRMRTLELQRPMVRATNTGATVVIDFDGRVSASLPPYSKGVLQARVTGRSGLTPYAWWAGHAGLWPLAALVVAGVLAAPAGPLRRRA